MRPTGQAVSFCACVALIVGLTGFFCALGSGSAGRPHMTWAHRAGDVCMELTCVPRGKANSGCNIREICVFFLASCT